VGALGLGWPYNADTFVLNGDFVGIIIVVVLMKVSIASIVLIVAGKEGNPAIIVKAGRGVITGMIVITGIPERSGIWKGSNFPQNGVESNLRLTLMLLLNHQLRLILTQIQIQE